MDTNETQVVTQTEAQTTEAVAESPSWFWADGVAGQGDKPEYYKDSKYKSVSEQAKAYIEAEKKLGGFVGAPTEGYQLSEELSSFKDDPIMQNVMPILQKGNASNEFVNELVSTFAQSQQKMQEQFLTEQKQLLGTNAEARLNSLVEFANVNIPAELRDDFKNMATSAKSVEVLEALMSKLQGGKVAPTETTASKSVTPDTLRDMMMATNETGQLKMSIDPNYKKMVDKAYSEFYK